MLRRVPWAPLLFGVFAAWTLLSMLASGQRELSETRIYVIVGAAGGMTMLLLNLFVRLVSGSVTGRGCLYAAAGFGFVMPIAAVVAILTGRGVTATGWGPGIMMLTSYAGLGVLGGLWYTRFVRAETERQQAALAQQQLEIARDLQQRLLPPSPLTTERYVVEARNAPAVYVAGDFYDFVPLPNDRLLIVVADVAGKGVAAGLIMATTKAIIPLLAAQEQHLARLVGNLNEQLARQLQKRDFVAAAFGLYNIATGDLTIANAGLPDPVVIAGEAQRTIVVPGPRYPLGIRSRMSYESVTLRLAPGDRAVFFTDGLPEAMVGGQPLGYERLHEEIGTTRGNLDRLFAAVERLSSGTHDDDWTAVTLQRSAL